MKYTYKVPPTDEMGSHTGFCRGPRHCGPFTLTFRADALDDYNRSRAREGLEKLRRMPAGTTYTRR